MTQHPKRTWRWWRSRFPGPGGADKAWRKVIAGVDDRAKGVYGVLEEFAEPGSRIPVP